MLSLPPTAGEEIASAGCCAFSRVRNGTLERAACHLQYPGFVTYAVCDTRSATLEWCIPTPPLRPDSARNPNLHGREPAFHHSRRPSAKHLAASLPDASSCSLSGFARILESHAPTEA